MLEVVYIAFVGILNKERPQSHFEMLEIVSVFILVLSWFSISNGVWTFPDMQLDPPPVLPVDVSLQIDTEVSCCPVKVDFVVENCTYLFIGTVKYFDSTNTSRVIDHLSSELDGVLASLLNFDDGQISLRH